jgi:hypothetical protein
VVADADKVGGLATDSRNSRKKAGESALGNQRDVLGRGEASNGSNGNHGVLHLVGRVVG